MALHRLTSITMGVPNVAETAAYYTEFGLVPEGDGWFSTRDGGRQLHIVHAPTRPARLRLANGIEPPACWLLASGRLVQAKRHALIIAAITGVCASWPGRPAGPDFATEFTDAPNRGLEVRDAEKDHQPGFGGFMHSARDACRLDRRAVAAPFMKLPSEQPAVKDLRPSRVWRADLEMRRLSHTAHLGSQRRVHVVRPGR